MLHFELDYKSAIKNPISCLFKIEAEDTTVNSALKGQVVLPGAAIGLVYFLTEKRVSWMNKGLVREIQLPDEEPEEGEETETLTFSLLVATQRPSMGSGVVDKDLVTVRVNGRTVGHDLKVRQDEGGKWIIHRFEAYSTEESELRFGRPYKIKASNGFFLSLLPNFKNSKALFIPEDQQSKDALEKADNFPEYCEELRADLSSDKNDVNSVWIIENNDCFIGGVIHSGEQFFLKHLGSNKYLCGDMTLAAKDQAKPLKFLSTVDEGSLVYSEPAEMITSEETIVSLDVTPTYQLCKAQLFKEFLTSLPRTTVLRHGLQGALTESATETLKFEVNYMSSKECYDLIYLVMQISPIVKLRIALQHASVFREQLESLLEKIDLDSLTLEGDSNLNLGNALGDFQFPYELLRIHCLILKYNEDTSSTLSFTEDIYALLSYWQYFEGVKRSLLHNKETFLTFLSARPCDFAEVLQWGFQTYPLDDDSRRYWLEVIARPDFTHLSLFDLTHQGIAFLFSEIIERLPPRVRFDWLIGDEKLETCLDGETLEGFPTMETVTRDKAIAFVYAFASHLAHNQALKQVMADKLCLTTATVLANYRSASNALEQFSFLNYIANVATVEECGPMTISDFTEKVFVSRVQLSQIPSRPADWFFFPSPDSPLRELVKDELYFWLLNSHASNPDIDYFLKLSRIHLNFAEQLIEHYAVSDIFVASILLSAAALARTVFRQPIEGFTNRFPNLDDAIDSLVYYEKNYIQNFLELVDTYQRWKKLKIMQLLATKGSTIVTQTEVKAYLSEFTLSAIVAKYAKGADLETDSHSPDLSGERMSPLLKALNTLVDHPLCQLEGLLIYIFKETHYHCKRQPQYILELIDREADMSRYLCQHLQSLVEITPYSDLLAAVENLSVLHISSFELERNPASDVKGFEPFMIRLRVFVKIVHSFANIQEANDSLRTLLLQKLNFERILENMWFLCTAIGPAFSEDRLYIEFRKLIFSLTRFFMTKNQLNRKKVLSIFPVSAFFPDYPEYILLLRELGILESSQNCSRLAQAILSFAGTSEARRSVLALKEMLRDSKICSEVVLTLISSFRMSTKETLTGAEWEILALICTYIPRNERSDLLKNTVEKLVVNPEFVIKKEIVILLIASEEELEDCAAEALDVLEPFFNTLLEKSAEQICQVFSALSDVSERNAESTSDDTAFILETIWSPDMICFLGKTPDFCPFLISLFNIIRQDSACSDFSIIFHSQVEALTKAHRDNPDSQEIITELQQCAAVSRFPRPALRSICPFPPVQPLFQVVMEHCSTRRLPLERLLSDVTQNPTNEMNLNSSEERTIRDIKFLFKEVQKWFLEKKIEIDYLRTCEIAGNLIDSDSSKGQEMVLARIIEGLWNVAVEKDEKVMIQALEACIAIVRKVENTREFVLEAFKTRRRYLQIMIPFQDFVRNRRELKKIIGSIDQGKGSFYLEKLGKVNRAIEAFLRLFQYCCDGCYSPFQDFLRDQVELSSINIIALTAQLLTEAFTGPTQASEQQLRETACLMLVEALSGPNSTNQRAVSSTEGLLEAVESQVKAALYASEKNITQRNDTANLLKVVYVLLEGRERNWEAIQEVMPSIDFDIFKQLALKKAQSLDASTLSDIRLGVNTEEQKAQFDFALQCLQVSFLVTEDLKAFRAVPLTQFLASVEIQESAESIRYISFPVPLICHYLTSQTALKLLLEINRESRQVKLDDFTSKLPICLLEMTHQYAISQVKGLKAVTKHWKTYWEAAFALVALINVVLISVVEPNDGFRFHIESEWLWVMSPLSILQIICSFLGVVSYYIEYFYILKSPLQEREQPNEIEKLPTLSSPGSMNAYLTMQKPETPPAYDLQEVLKALLRVGVFVLACVAPWQPVLYPVLLFQIANLNDSIVTILRSVTERWSQLALTYMFALITMYGFTVVAYFFLYSYYRDSQGIFCDTLLSCFLSTVNYGMMGGLSGAFGPTLPADFNLRLVFDLLFFILITTILMAIVYGIIVDTFSELRGERNERELDMSNVCFICGKSRSVIELKGEGWQTHTFFTHNPFAYLYFNIYLRRKDSMDCTGIEKVTKERMEAGDISFYPTTSRQLGFDID